MKRQSICGKRKIETKFMGDLGECHIILLISPVIITCKDSFLVNYCQIVLHCIVKEKENTYYCWLVNLKPVYVFLIRQSH
jgi:hypothetical protein